MFKWTSFALTALAVSMPPSATYGRGDMGCLPPVTQDYIKKTVNVEIRGKLERVEMWLEGPRDSQFPMPNVGHFEYWQVTVDGKTYSLEFGERKDVSEQATKLAGKTAIITGTLDGDTVHLTGLKAAA